MSENVKALGDLTADQQALLLLMLQKKAQARAEQRIPRVTSGGQQPLSFAQERLWLVDQFEPDTPTYNIPGGVRLTGSLRFSALEQSINELVRRHDALRTCFVDSAGKPAQHIAPELDLQLPLVDLRGLSASEQQEQAARLSREETRRPFDLRHAPLLRVQLLQLSAAQHEFLFTMHHIVSDGWSMSVLVREVGALYPAYVSGESSPLPELAIQYSDFAVWQRERLQGEVLDAELSYWKQQLANAPEVLELPTDRTRPRLGSSRGSSQSFALSEPVNRGLRELSKQSNTTLFMTLLAAFKALLYRYTRQTDILVGTPVANRNRLQIEPLIGFFVNTLVLRTQLNGDTSFRGLLQQVRETVLGAQGHQELPFERLVQELAPERSLGHAPLFQVMMVLDNSPARRLELPELELQAIAPDLATAKFDLTLVMSNRESGELSGVIEYNTDLFDRSRMARLAEHFSSLVGGVVEDADQPLARLPLLSSAERQRLLVEWNDTESVCQSYCIHELFAEQVRQRPDAVAVVFDTQQISYAELDTRSNDLAHRLRQLGVGVESSVAICVDRSIERIVGLLGILKAGGVYVPLDSDYPTERLSFMLNNSQIAVLLTDDKTAARMAELANESIPQLNLDQQTIVNETPITLDASFSSGEQLAYISYTSGSTGLPKGVSIAHRSVARLVNGADYVRFNSNDVYLHLSSLSFDAATFDIWGALLNGGRVAVMPPGPISVEELTKVLKRDQVTTLFLTTALFNLMVQEQPAALASIPEVLSGGEHVSIAHVHNHLAAMAAAKAVRGRFIHVYGPTEVTTFSTGEAFTAQTPNPATVSIGRPIANTTAYVLDAQLQPVPTGVYGELFLGGLGLARGYYGQASLTAERFIPDVFSGAPAKRLYRTGDVVRQLADGRIEFLGRTDHQIKLRGFRIELGEIETALTHSEGVRQAVVLMREDTPGDKRLVAYVVPETEEFSIADLRRDLHTELPDYMVPSAFVLLDELPLNPNGKVNRKALPVPESTGTTIGYIAPRTPTEQIVADIWAEVLKLEQVGVEDNFFDLGGHSLLAAQVVSRVRTACKVELPLRALFETGTVAALAQIIEEEAQQKLELLLPLVSVNRDGPLPLSFAQERLWFLNQFEPQSAFYNIPIALRLRGRLSLAALESTLNELLRRHEVLRTTFTGEGGKPEQMIDAAQPRPLLLIDLAGLATGEREAAVQKAIREDARRPFDLVFGPLVRQQVLRVGEAEHVVLLTMHHIITDGWSMGVLVKEVAALYEVYRRGEQSPLPELEIQYADFAVWQREWLQGEVLDAELSYWKQQLADAPEVLELPTDRPRPRLESFRGAYQRLDLSADIARRLTEVSQQQGTTLFMTLLAAFKALLSRYTGQTDLVVGTPIANRNRVEIEPLIGFFVNTLVLRTQLHRESSFRELLQQVRETVLGAQAHQALPFERLVQELAPERSLSHAPLFQVMMVLNERSAQKLELPELELQAVGGDSATAKFDLMLVFSTNRESGELRGVIEYNRDLFDRSRMARLAEHFTSLLSAVVEDTEQPLARLPLLNEAEQHRLLVEWNDTDSAERPQSCVHELLAVQSQLTPEAVALEFEDETLAYAELNARANQLAHYLRKYGVGPDVLVGLCLEPSLELIIGMLGILKAGGAYVPFDPAYPQERLSFMLADSQAPVIVTQERYTDLTDATEIVCLDRDWNLIAREPESDINNGVSPDNLAYVMYTSGSTGVPKGVSVNHRAVVRLVQESNYADLNDSHTFFQLAPVSFDASTLEIWGSLLNGARLAVMRGGTPSLQELGTALRRYHVTTLWLTAGLFHLMVDQQLDDLKQLKQLLAGGDVLSVAHVRRFLANAPGCKLINGYGPTENTTFTCCHPMTEAAAIDGSVPIGRPITNTQVYILDGELQPVPVGAVGELYTSGDGLARGYFSRASLTAERFIPNPFSLGERLYKTGDQVRHLPGGQIEFIGRTDHQVKLRGFRIELPEIEAALSAHPSVRENVVVARQDMPGEKRLVAYVVPVAEEPAVSELRSFLREKLPDYMVPAAFVLLDELPLNPNGKVNRKALPVPESTGTTIDFVPPRTPTEQIVADIWAEVLKLEQVGVEDNFFDLGGHSLLAAQVVSRVRTACKVELPLRALFETGTVAALAQIIEEEAQQKLELLLPLVSVNRDGPLPLSFAQERLWFLNQFEPQSAFYNIPIALRLRGRLSLAALESTLNELLRRHEVLRTTFTGEGGKPEQMIGAAQPRPLPLIDLAELAAEEREAAVQKAIREDARRPFDLVLGPLVRQQVLRVGEAEHVVLLTMHHIITDGWSMGVLVKEVASLYEVYRRGEQSPLPELAIQYADFAVWQREWLQGEVLDAELSYWKQQLADAPEVLELPTDRPRPRLESFRGSSQPLVLSEPVSHGLRELSKQSGTTLFVTLLAAFKALLYRYTGQADILIGTPIANRNRLEIEPLIGFFVNTLVLRTQLNGESSFRALLQQVRETVLGAQGHQELPFERLVQELAPERSLSHAPLFQVSMLLDNRSAQKLELPELELQAIAPDLGTSKFDLLLALSNRESGELRGVIEYNRDLFDSTRMARLAEHFSSLVSAIVENAEQSLARLPLLSSAEQHRLLVEWNDTKSVCQSYCIHELFVEQVQQRPDAVAVVFDTQQISYAELDARSNDLAHRLRQLGVGVESSVAICVDRSIERIVGLLGILKAGGVYVPLDSDYPTERLSFMFNNSQITVLLTDDKTAARMAELANESIPQLNLDQQTIVNETPIPLDASYYSGEQLAYISYTSGSTGLPKGVSIAHRSVARLVNGADYVRFNSNDVYLHLSSLSFDAATFDIWGALLNGGRVAVMPAGPISVEELTKVLKRDQVTTLFLTTALFNLMVQEQPAALACVPEVLSGGEQHSTIHIKNHLAAMTEAGTTDTSRFMNAYGPTEVTTFSTTETITANPATVSMGRPIANTTTYVLDAQLRPVPVGVYGELYLGGLGLARGYYGQTSLTAERFIPDVFSGEQGARLYRTGDVVRQLGDGRIEFLGRRDHQIKLRGFRIELGEIETALTHSEGVRQAVVLMREDTPGDKRLVAYIVPETEEFSIAELRRDLHTELPDYMVPSAFVLLDELPLNPNGKVDRQLLPEPARSERTEREREPRTLVEEILAGIWSEVLGLDHVGVDEDFFELGGHSLLAVRVASRVRTALDYELPLRAIFEAPTLAALAARIEEERQRASGVSLPPITPALREGPLPLSFAQERLWFIDRLDEGSAVYNLSTAVKLEGSLQITALEQSLTELVRRHEILRTSFVEIDGQPAQMTAATMSLPLRVTNLKRIKNGERAAAQVIAQETSPAFDLTRLPLMRARLVQLSDREHALVLTFHHIITDGWSMRVLVKELTTLYAAFSNGEPSPLPDLTLQYADYSAWQQRWLLGEVLDQQLAYWKRQLDGAPELLELPLDHPRPQLRRYRGAVQSRRLSATLSKELRTLSRSNGSTLFMTLLATFQLMLSRYSGQEDIVVGAPSAGRSRTELEGQIGFFINTLALRTDLSGNPSFLELLTRVRKMTLEAFAHQDAPFEKLLEELQVQRDLSRTPLIQVFFNMLNLPSPQADLSELRITPLSQEAGAKFDLTFYIADGRDGLHFNLVYDADLFEPARMTEMLEQFECLLEQIVAEPNRELANFSLVSSRARALLPEPTLPLEPTWPGAVHQLFIQRAKRTPNQTAVVDSQGAWSYLELDRRSNQLARHLHAKGIRASDVVAIYGERNARLVCALLGVLKAGAAFMILDPANPDSYLDECLRVAQPRCSLQLNEIDVLTDSDDDVDIDTRANDLAYIAFTSGSTGTPKGIAGEHGPLAHFVEWHAHTFDLQPGDRFSMLSGLSHDPLLRDIFTPLSVGATLCIPEMVAGGRLADWITQQQIMVMHLTPPTLQLLLDVPQEEVSHKKAQKAQNQESDIRFPDLRYAFFGGDTLTMADVSQLRRLAPQVECVNFYGATETPQAMGFYVVTPAHEDIVPVGRGIDGVQLLVLNRAGELAGVAEAGEICIRTPYLSRGYINDDELNATRFVSDPFGSTPAVRIYRTGDRGRYLPDGNVEFLGRMDREIKVLGHRVDPEAIEVVLRSNTSVRDAVVVPRGDGFADKALVAYVVSQIDASELRTYLRAMLPPYMIPSAFVRLDALPLTPNGKVDINALPVPDSDEELSPFVASRTPIEEVLCGIWSDLLGRRQIGVHDNFFDLGGHSLLATQVIARVRRAFHVELPLRRLFERPTVAVLAETIDESIRVKADLAVPAIEPVLRDVPLPLSFAQERLWFLHLLQPESFAYNMPAWIDLTGPLNPITFDQATTEIVRRHEILRTSFAVSGGQPVQVVDEPPRSMLMVVDLSGLANPEAQAQSLSREQARRPFDLARSPLLSGILLCLNDEHHSLLLNLHHIAADAWSTTIFINEVGTLYGSFLKGEQSQLPELAIQYVDFAAWQRSWLQGEVLATQLAYWKQQLQNSPPMLELPTDRPRPPVQTFRGETATLNVPEELTSRLTSLSRRNGATLFMTLMAVFKTLLYRYTGSEDIVVGTGIAERKSVELERMIGLFINQLAIRTQLSAQQTFLELLENVRDRSLGAYAHQDLPFEKLVAELQPERSLSRTPLFQVMLMMQTAPRKRTNLTDVSARLRAKAAAGAKFDLTMHVVPTDSDLRIVLEYNTILFDANRVHRLLGHFHSLLADVARKPEQRLGHLELLTEDERSQLLVDWNNTDAPHQRDVCIHQLIEAQAEQTPDRIAIEFEGEALTYAGLNARANQLAHYLRRCGVGPDEMVGVCLERSLEMIVAMLGILKAGGAYVPLDPAYPAERIEFMLDDTHAPVLLTQERVAAQKELAKRDAHVVCLDRDWSRVAPETSENLCNVQNPDKLAYVIYTSGSTGRPKGVAIQHSSAVALIAWANDVFTPEEFKGVLASTSICFDLSIFEIFAPLSSGGRVIVVADALRLPTLKSAAGVTLLNTVPSAAAELLRSGGLPQTIETVNLAGEPLSTSLVRQLYDFGIKRVFDLYGPTEDTTYSTYALRAGTGQATIGRPISNTKSYVLDQNLQPVPVGVPGELYLGGEGLARGYLNRAEMTATRFMPNPFDGGRVYKTGDLVRYLEDGRLEYLGRTDHQIKLRGFRIELGEIEAALRQHPQIRENIVLVREDEPGDRRLVAYLVTTDEIPISDLRAFLRKKLPDYMVPSAFVRLDALPLTANGKVDRKALPQPDDPSSRARSKYVAPRAELERRLVKIWQELLRVETVGVEDNFFDLGGHSLLLVRLVQEIQNSLGLEVALMEMFEHPTVASLARHLSRKQTQAPALHTVVVDVSVAEEAAARRRRRSKRLQASNNA